MSRNTTAKSEHTTELQFQSASHPRKVKHIRSQLTPFAINPHTPA